MTQQWKGADRAHPTWCRFNSPREDLYVIEDSALVLYGKLNDNWDADPVEFLTGALNTKDSFSCQYGVVEARIKTSPHKGNFPAFWMMPVDASDGWPECGEIDIFEQIDDENASYHTTHGYWTNHDGAGRSVKKPGDMTDWHVYSLEWTPESLTWLVDGNVVEVQRRDHTDTNPYAWPFDKPFYIIINQAVGNGSWAGPYDPAYVYSTAFDYVRVYKKP